MTTPCFNRTGLLRFYGTPLMTPVLAGLFGAYAPQCGLNDPDTIELLVTTEGVVPAWTEIGTRVALALGMNGETGAADALMELATLYGGDAMGIVAAIVERFDSSVPDVGSLFMLALACNDGHALRSVEVEGGWAPQGAPHGGCGGDAQYVSAGVHIALSTALARDLGCRLEAGLEGGSESALEDAFWMVEALIAGGIKDEASKGVVRTKLAAFLLRNESSATQELDG